MRSGCCVSGRRGDELMSVDMLLLNTNVSSVLEFSGGLEDFLFRISDIFGEITAVKSSVSDPPADNNHLMATIKLENYVLMLFRAPLPDFVDSVSLMIVLLCHFHVL
ncbi:hypothetical protein F2Q69_00051586 [Brassica cretica]|uniref:Uncharacterized protein n=1 Tax=Brassica cretica TaxID=69181 RepID=A0A8S9PVF3_BRACR|nr:hypothetical protein F2Q69_00051586 [Brassica cretica]